MKKLPHPRIGHVYARITGNREFYLSLPRKRKKEYRNKNISYFRVTSIAKRRDEGVIHTIFNHETTKNS